MTQTFPADCMPAVPDRLSPEARAYLASMAAQRIDVMPEMAVARMFSEQVQQALGAEQRKTYDVTVTDDVIAGVPVRRIAPAAGHDPSRVLMNVHGGGFATDSGSLTENIPIAALTGVEVVAVLYRFAPEHPFPAAIDDALAVYKALLEGREPRNVGVYGTSAGAVIGPQLMMRLKAEGLPSPGALGVFSGEPDLAGQTDSMNIFARPFEAQILTDAKDQYIAGSDARDPLVSPIYGDLSHFPPTLCLSSGRDIMLSGTVILAQALEDAGVHSELVVYDALPHAFWAQMLAPECDACFRRMASFLARNVG
jgi:acetyl esterase/lipase